MFATKPPALVVTRSLAVFSEIMEFASQYGVPVLRTAESTSGFMSALISMLNIELAQRITRHGVLVEVYGEGILILGESGVGKSETAVELVKRGHRLIADDAVELRRVSKPFHSWHCAGKYPPFYRAARRGHHQCGAGVRHWRCKNEPGK